MPYLPELITPFFLGLAVIVTFVSGFVKGAVGFGMPMIMISGMGSFLSPELALAALIVPTVLSNVWQAVRGGFVAAWRSVVSYRVYIAILLVCIALSSQLVGRLSASWLYFILGVPVTGFALTQLMGWHIRVGAKHMRRVEVMFATLAGLIGGLTGVWGPPTIAYLTTLNTPKGEQVRVQGVIYGAGAIVLFFAHLKSGVLNSQSLQLSLWMVVPAMVGMGVGFWVQDRLDQARFRRVTLVVLVAAGLNLIRRGVMG